MYFSRSFVISALLGVSAATTHLGEAGASTATLAASESLSETAAATGETAAATGAMTPEASGETATATGAMTPEASGETAVATGAMTPEASGAAAAGEIATHIIQVGGPNGSTIFSPESITANVGDLVQFQFHPKNHSVVQSSFDQPCTPIQNGNSSMTAAFFSGFMPTNASVGATSQVLTYTIRVMDAKPVWFYCSQAKHCQAGMVGAINAATSGNKTMEAFKALAKQATENLSPGQGAGSVSPSSGAGADAGSGTGSGTEGASSAAGGAGGAAATASSASDPAQQTTNAAPGLYDASKQPLFGLTVGAFVALLAL